MRIAFVVTGAILALAVNALRVLGSAVERDLRIVDGIG